MRKFPLFGIGLLVLGLIVFTGCSGQQGGTPKDGEKSTKKGGDDDHDHGPGPHNGTIIEFGKWHGEFTVNHKIREATVYILGADAKTPVPLQIEKPLLSIKTPQFQVELKPAPQEGDPAGKSSRFVGKHENFGKQQEFEGTFSGVVDGKPYAGDFKEEEHKDHKDHKPEKK
jgi:hypothetical protein